MANTPSPPISEIDYVLGIQYGDFDDQITASSIYDSTYATSNCKLNGPRCWVPADSDKNGYIQVKFKNDFYINAISIQGRNKDDKSSQWVTKFRMLWSPDGRNYIHLCELKGNNDDNDTIVKRYLPEAILCKGIRIQPLECHNYRSMRFELHYIIPKDKKYSY